MILRLLNWALVLAYMSLIFYWSHQPSVPLPHPFPHFDKVVHFHAYLLLAFLLANAYRYPHSKKRFFFVFLVACLYGVSDEIHQSFIPGRESSVYDWLFDTAGAWVGAWAFMKSESIWKRK